MSKKYIKVFSICSFLFLFACLLSPILMIMAMNGVFAGSGEFVILLWVMFPLLGVICAFLGKKGWVKITGMLLNGIAFCAVLFIIIGRTDYL